MKNYLSSLTFVIKGFAYHVLGGVHNDSDYLDHLEDLGNQLIALAKQNRQPQPVAAPVPDVSEETLSEQPKSE